MATYPTANFVTNRMRPPPPFNMHNCICGFYFTSQNPNFLFQLPRTYLPQTSLKFHTTILSSTSRTTLKQTFVNPAPMKGIKELRYIFPLYDGVSVVGFICHLDGREIIGEVKEKEKARAVYKEAVSKGETAGLLEQLPASSDIFTTTIGNVPAGAKIEVEITYLGELKHDAEVDGTRFTIPTVIAPRYGSYPGELMQATETVNAGKGIEIIVDAEIAEGSFIQQIRSPSHPIAVTMGTTSIAPNGSPSMSKASATLSLSNAELDKDFVLQVIAKDTSVPKAIMETHPRYPNQRAVMATLVPKFVLPPEKPEIVFICDRSGSMKGTKMELVKSALRVFLKSLPLGVKFNICSFGTNCSFLWPRSQPYSQNSLDEAIQHIESFAANLGGTDILRPIQATFQIRYQDIPLEVMLLTDGEIWDQQILFNFVNGEVVDKKVPTRVFTLGIGNGASHALIEGLANAGNGFSQAVAEGEKLDNKIVRMLKGALSPHVNDYTLEVKYHGHEDQIAVEQEDEDFELVEKVTDSLKVQLNIEEVQEKEEPISLKRTLFGTQTAKYLQKKPISLFDTTVDPDAKEEPTKNETEEARYAHLPSIAIPKLLQAPHKIPTLFPFNRTTIYLLMGPAAPQKAPTSLVLRGTSAHGPLELEIPVHNLETPGETIHQLAAKKAIHELEQGRSWIAHAVDQDGTLLRSKFESRFDDMVEREAVRLGVQFQVGGKWCSFVAVEKSGKEGEDVAMTDDDWLGIPSNVQHAENGDPLSQASPISRPLSRSLKSQQRSATSTRLGISGNASMLLEQQNKKRLMMAPQSMARSSNRGAVAGSKVAGLASSDMAVSSGSGGGSSLFGIAAPPPPAPAGPRASRLQMQSAAPKGQSFGNIGSDSFDLTFGTDLDILENFDFDTCLSTSTDAAFPIAQPFGLNSGASQAPKPERIRSAGRSKCSSPPRELRKQDTSPLDALVSLQLFSGNWEWSPRLVTLVKVNEAEVDEVVQERGMGKNVAATALAVVFLEVKLPSEKDVWELIVDKARGWLAGEIGKEKVEEVITKMGNLIK